MLLQKISPSNVCLLVIICLGTLLSGCVSNVNIAKSLSKQQSLPAQEGILTVKVINASAYHLPFNQLFIEPKNVNASKEVKTLLASAEDVPIGDSSLFAVSLPSGEYSLATIRSFVLVGEGYYSRAAYVDPEFGTFKVEAGKVTDLGSLIYYAKPQDDIYKNVVVRLPDSAHGDVVKEYFPKYATHSRDILSWEKDERDDSRFSQYASIAQNPIVFTNEILAPDGNLYFLGKLGVILRYSPNDGFETLAVDTNLQLSTFAQNNAGDMLVGGYDSTLFFQPQGGEWESVKLPEKVTVHHVTFYQENQFDVVFSVGKKLRIARFDKESLNDYSILNTYTYYGRWEHAKKEFSNRATKKQEYNIKEVSVTDSGTQKLINVNTYKVGKWNPFDATDTETYAFSPDTWETRKYNDSNEVMDIIVAAGAVEMGIKQAGFWSLIGKPSYFSRVDGKGAWREVSSKILQCKKDGTLTSSGMCKVDNKVTEASSKSFSFRSLPWFWDANNGIAITTFVDVNIWSGNRKTEVNVLKTDDGGQTWEKTEFTLPKEYCSKIIGDITDRILLSCDGATSDFYESTDYGETWTHIRQQQDF